MRKIAIMGATGSIGLAALDVLRKQKDYQVIALAGKNNVDGLLPLIEEFLPTYAVLFEEAAAKKLQMTLAHRKVTCQVLSGEEGLKTIATLPDTDWVLAAISGSAGLLSTYEAAKAGKKILLANKESLVMARPTF